MGYKAILAASAGALGCRSIMRKRAPWLRRRAMLQLPAVDCAADGRTHDPLPGWLQLHPQARRPDVHRLRARPLSQRPRLGLPRRAPPHARRDHEAAGFILQTTPRALALDLVGEGGEVEAPLERRVGGRRLALAAEAARQPDPPERGPGARGLPLRPAARRGG